MLAAPTAYLRVYEPLSSFPDQERARWEEYADGRATGDPVRVTLQEFESLARAMVHPEVLADVEDDEAFVTTVDGQTYVCPWRTWLRSVETMLSFRGAVPTPVAEALCPASVSEQLATELEGWKRLNPGLRSHILSTTWVVPARWYVGFEPVERAVVTRSGAMRSMVYRAEMGRVRRRVTRALTVLRQSFGTGGPTSEVEVLERWFDRFHPRSLVELDYGRLVDLMDDEAMRSDESAADVMDSLDALARGEVEQAGEAYERVVGRWQRMAGRERAS